MNEIGMYYRNYFIQHTHNRCTDQPEQHNILQRLFSSFRLRTMPFSCRPIPSIQNGAVKK